MLLSAKTLPPQDGEGTEGHSADQKPNVGYSWHLRFTSMWSLQPTAPNQHENTSFKPLWEHNQFFPPVARHAQITIQWNTRFYWTPDIGTPSKIVFYVILCIGSCWNIYQHVLWLPLQEFIQIYSILLFVLCQFLLINFFWLYVW